MEICDEYNSRQDARNLIRISVAGVMLVVKGLIQVTSDNTQALLQKNIIYNLCNIILVQGIEYISTMKLFRSSEHK